MECIPFAPSHLANLTNLINAQMAVIPPWWAFSQEQVSHTVNSASDLWRVHFLDQSATYALETLCVLEGKKLLAAAQWGTPVTRRGIDNSGILFWIVSEPAAGKALSLLLETIKAHSHHAGNPRIVTPRYSFGLGWLGIPVMWTHVTGAMQAAGFIPKSRWSVFTGSVNIPEIEKPELLQSLQVSWFPHEDVQEWDLKVYDNDKLAGECSAWGTPSHFSGCPGFDNWITLEWLGVEPEYQRKGLGRWLATEQLSRQAERGITQVILWTETNNHPALRLNSSLGFKLGFESWDFEVDHED